MSFFPGQNLRNGMCYSYLIQVLSMSLIIFGVTYKVFLKGILKDVKKYESSGVKTSRMLGAAPEISDETSAYVFAKSLAVVCISLELMCLTHSGVQKALDHLVLRKKDGRDDKAVKKSPHWPVIIISLFKVATMVFTITLSLWTTNPAVLTMCGCGIIFSLSITRVANYFFIHKKEVLKRLSDEVMTTVSRATAMPTTILSNTTERAAQMGSAVGGGISDVAMSAIAPSLSSSIEGINLARSTLASSLSSTQAERASSMITSSNPTPLLMEKESN